MATECHTVDVGKGFSEALRSIDLDLSADRAQVLTVGNLRALQASNQGEAS